MMLVKFLSECREKVSTVFSKIYKSSKNLVKRHEVDLEFREIVKDKYKSIVQNIQQIIIQTNFTN